MSEQKEKLQSGIFKNISHSEYHSWDAVSNSCLSNMAISAKKCKYFIDNPKESTPAMLSGDVVHVLTLQPDTFSDRFLVSEQCFETTDKGKRCTSPGKAYINQQWKCGKHCDLSSYESELPIITSSDFDIAEETTKAIRNNADALNLLKIATEFELSGVWLDESSGLHCKLRADAVIENVEGFPNTIIDLKKTVDASPEAFERSIYKYGYHRQAAWYLYGMAKLGKFFEHYVIIAVEDTNDHGVGVYRLTDEALQKGNDHVMSLFDEYVQCSKSGIWPDYTAEITPIGVPDWAKYKLKNREVA